MLSSPWFAAGTPRAPPTQLLGSRDAPRAGCGHARPSRCRTASARCGRGGLFPASLQKARVSGKELFRAVTSLSVSRGPRRGRDGTAGVRSDGAPALSSGKGHCSGHRGRRRATLLSSVELTAHPGPDPVSPLKEKPGIMNVTRASRERRLSSLPPELIGSGHQASPPGAALSGRQERGAVLPPGLEVEVDPGLAP